MTNWPDPARPGVPLNPERDGWHWLETPDGERVPYEWRRAGECERGRWPSYWVSQGEDCWEAPACKYLGPVLTPDEATALQKRVAELEGALERLARLGAEPYYGNSDGNMIARAALEGKKDE